MSRARLNQVVLLVIFVLIAMAVLVHYANQAAEFANRVYSATATSVQATNNFVIMELTGTAVAKTQTPQATSTNQPQ